jgi:hypothetical protein
LLVLPFKWVRLRSQARLAEKPHLPQKNMQRVLAKPAWLPYNSDWRGEMYLTGDNREQSAPFGKFNVIEVV